MKIPLKIIIKILNSDKTLYTLLKLNIKIILHSFTAFIN